MITCQIEDLTKGLAELKPLFPLHWAELALNKDKVPLDPQYEEYLRRDALGQITYVTCRKDGILIGYFVFFNTPGLHYKTCLTCIMDIFYVHPDHRGDSCGWKLLECAKAELKRRGVNRWFVGHKEHSKKAGVLFEKFGFEKVETTYSMWLGD